MGFDVTATDLMPFFGEMVVDDISASALKLDFFGAVLCVSTLEHIENHETALANMRRLLRTGGVAVITAPYHDADFVPDVDAAAGRKPQLYGTCAFSRKQVDVWVRFFGNEIERRHWRVFTGDGWGMGERLPRPKPSKPEDAHLVGVVLRKASE